MPNRKRSAPAPHAVSNVELFADSAEAWFWFAHCQMLRRDGARLVRDNARWCRPCEPDDIYRTVIGLRRSGDLSRRHLSVLARYGSMLRPPDAREPHENGDARLWEQALDRMTTPLRAKNIIQSVDYNDEFYRAS